MSDIPPDRLSNDPIIAHRVALFGLGRLDDGDRPDLQRAIVFGSYGVPAWQILKPKRSHPRRLPAGWGGVGESSGSVMARRHGQFPNCAVSRY